MKVKLRAIMTIEYEADSKYYSGANTAEEMASIDEKSFKDDWGNYFSLAQSELTKVRVEIVGGK